MTRTKTILSCTAWLLACGGDDGGTTAAADSTSMGTASTGSSSGAGEDSSSDGGATSLADGSSSSDGGSSTGEAGALLDDYPLVGDTLFPEGVAFDPARRQFLFGSLGDGAIGSISADGATQSMLVASPGATWSTAGIKVDAAADVLWACTGDDAHSEIWRVALADGTVQAQLDLTAATPGAGCNDLALDGSGRVYVTDPGLGIVHRIDTDDSITAWATDDAFAPGFGGLGLNGIAATPDDAAIVVAYYAPPQLFLVAQDDATVGPVTLDGDAFAGGTALSGADGIVFAPDGTLYVVFYEQLAAVTLDVAAATGTVTTVAVPGIDEGLSTATIAEGRVYAAKSEVQAYALGGAPMLPFRIVHAAL